MRKRNGSILNRRGSWWARVTFVDPVTGKRRELTRKAKSKSDARDLRDRLLREIDDSDGYSASFDSKTMSDLCEFYLDNYAGAPEYVGEKKVSGLRSFDTVRGQIETIRKYFGKKRVRTLTYEDLRRFKADRLRVRPVWAERAIQRESAAREEALTRKDNEAAAKCAARIEELSTLHRQIASVNRELALLNRMLGIAVRQRWIQANPFAHGERLASAKDERERQRILTEDEEQALLAACAKHGRPHLRPIVICALDTGMRQGEILKLVWSDVDFDSEMISVRAFNTKTMTARQVAMTPRLKSALKAIRTFSGSEALVFGVKDNVKKSFAAARKAAGLPDVRFHDLRHTAASRLAAGAISLPEIGRILGHTQPRTTYRYVNANEETARRAAAVLARTANAE